MRETKIGERFFKRNGCRIIQDPSEIKLMECLSKCEGISGKLSLSSKLFYLGIMDSGEDSFTALLEIERPTRWQGGAPETFTIVREFLHLSDIKKWILGLEAVILGAIFSKESTDNEAVKVSENRTVVEMLLDLTKDFTKLNQIIREDATKRQDLLDSR